MKKVNKSLSVGQTVWCLELDRRSNDVSLKETKITKIGKKYFEIELGRRCRFFIDSLKHDNSGYPSRYMIYLSKEQYENEVEVNEIYSKLRNIFSGYGNPTIELSKLRQIISILQTKNE